MNTLPEHTPLDLARLESLLPRVLAPERPGFQAEIDRLRRGRERRPGRSPAKSHEQLARRIHASVRRRERRRQNLPVPAYDAALPIVARKDDIIEAIQRHQVVIIAGETGSGKTTQIPKFCLEAGRGVDGMIGCTQPRRIAALTVARRIAEELGEDLGRSVGHKIRFTDTTRRDAYIKIMTDGILLAETQGDPFLSGYDTLIVDEAHERSLNIDFVLGILKTLLPRRPDLKLIITSATIDTQKFSQAFDDAPVVEVTGRMFPVEVRYLEPQPTDGEEDEPGYVEMAVKAVDRIHRESLRGDVLVFMPTEQDIRETCEMLTGRGYPRTAILPLYARLSAADQAKVFFRFPGRKIIVATNVAETSLTIPGIRYVVDTGLARTSEYAPKTRTTSLPIKPISQSSADQRKGRCGRVEGGVCIRLFSREDYESRPLYTLPEIQRANLAEVILRMIALRLGDVARFPFIDRPADKSIQDGFNLLLELGAIRPGKGGKQKPFALTPTGRLMARLPLDPRISRMLIQAREEGCLEDMIVIAAALSIQDPRERPAEKSAEADRAHGAFNDPESDFVSLLNIWRRYHETLQAARGSSQVKRFLKDHFLSYRRMREWRDIHGQIRLLLEEAAEDDKEAPPAPAGEAGSGPGTYKPRYAAIHKSILSGFLTNIALRKEKNFFQAAKGREVMIFPGSGLFNRAGTWIVAAEMLETSRLFARTAANIDPAWLEKVGRHQVKYSYFEPRFDPRRGEVVAREQVGLYGLVIVPGRRVSYGRIHPAEASQVFIQEALVEGRLRTELPFLKHNQTLVREIEDLENRLRRRDLLVPEGEIFAFYQERLSGVFDVRTLQREIKTRGDEFLRLAKEDLLLYRPDPETLALYPEKLPWDREALRCSYTFDPRDPRDGVTVRVPAHLAPEVPARRFEWLVPGLLKEKIAALIRGLPKALRKQLVPIADTVEVIAREMAPEDVPLATALGHFIQRRFGVAIPAEAWPTDQLPMHLRMRIALTGPKGEEIASSRDPAILAQGVASDIDDRTMARARETWERDGITAWDFGDLPQSVTVAGTEPPLLLYPALAVDGALPGNGRPTAAIRLFRSSQAALASHRQGVAVLFEHHLSRDLKFLRQTLFLPAELRPAAAAFGGVKALEQKLYASVIADLFAKDIRTRQTFLDHARAVGPTLLKTGHEKLEKVAPVLKAAHETGVYLDTLARSWRGNPMLASLIQSIRQELARLLPDHFLALYETARLPDLARYIRAREIRTRRALDNLEKDRQKAEEMAPYQEALAALVEGLAPDTSAEKRRAVEDFYWALEEYRVSLFAQELKTAFPVSPNRLDRQLEAIRRMV